MCQYEDDLGIIKKIIILAHQSTKTLSVLTVPFLLAKEKLFC